MTASGQLHGRLRAVSRGRRQIRAAAHAAQLCCLAGAAGDSGDDPPGAVPVCRSAELMKIGPAQRFADGAGGAAGTCSLLARPSRFRHVVCAACYSLPH